MKLSKSQLFSVFVLFWIGLGFLGILLALAGIFFKTILIAYLAIGIGAMLFLLLSNLRLLRLIHPGFISASAIMIAFFLAFSYFSSPTIFSGRDQGSLSEAAIRLSENHQLAFSFPAEKDFFEIYGPGKALNFPGFNYTQSGQLITQFPLGYVSWLAVFYSLLGLNGLILANAVLFFIFLASFYLLLRNTSRVSSSLIGIFLVLTSFVFSWFFKFTLSENMALAFSWFAVWSFAIFLKNQKRFYLLSSILSLGLLVFARIEALTFIFMMALVLYLISKRRKINFFDLVGKKAIWISGIIGFIYLISFYVNRQFFVALAKAVLGPTPGAANGAMVFSSFFSSLGYTFKIFFIYNLFGFLLLGAAGALYLYQRKRSLLVPLFIFLPSFFYVFFPNISGDHPWMLRRFLFAVIPAGIYYTVIFLDNFFKKRIFFYLITIFLIGFNLQLFFNFLPIVPHKQLMTQTNELSANFEDSDLVLVDREASGDGWSMISGPLNFMFGKQAVYFFNPADIKKIDVEKYTNVYLIIPDSQIALYEKSGLTEKISEVTNYGITNNFLKSDIMEKNVAYSSPVVLPREQVVFVPGKIYKLNK